MPEFDQSLYWKLVPYFCVPIERVHVILVVSGPSLGIANVRSLAGLQITIGSRSTLPIISLGRSGVSMGTCRLFSGFFS